MNVLDPHHTTFVIISSDQDFRHFYQLLKGEGYGVIVIHEAIEGNWVKVLEMHADCAYRWRDIMSDTDGTYTATATPTATDGAEGGGEGLNVHSDGDGNVDGATAVHQSSGSSSGGGQQRNQSQRQRQGEEGNGQSQGQSQTQGLNGHESAYKATYAEISKGASVTAHLVSDKGNPQGQVGGTGTNIVEYPLGFCLGWLEGTCIRWKGTYGFLSVQTLPVCPPTPCTDMSVQQPLRVYVHYKSLNFNVPTMQLSRGQRVRALLKIGDRGPYAVKVEPIYSEIILDS